VVGGVKAGNLDFGGVGIGIACWVWCIVEKAL
jgi:hypothetical protein